MQRLTVSINNQETEFIIIEAGEKAGKVRKSLGIDVSEVAGTSWLKTDEDVEDFEFDFPLAFEALSNAGVDFSSIIAVTELK